MKTVLLGVFFLPSLSFAYLDPGTGSYFLQILLALILGAAFSVKLYFQRVKLFFKSLFSKNPKE